MAVAAIYTGQWLLFSLLATVLTMDRNIPWLCSKVHSHYFRSKLYFLTQSKFLSTAVGKQFKSYTPKSSESQVYQVKKNNKTNLKTTIVAVWQTSIALIGILVLESFHLRSHSHRFKPVMSLLRQVWIMIA